MAKSSSHFHKRRCSAFDQCMLVHKGEKNRKAKLVHRRRPSICTCPAVSVSDDNMLLYEIGRADRVSTYTYVQEGGHIIYGQWP